MKTKILAVTESQILRNETHFFFFFLLLKYRHRQNELSSVVSYKTVYPSTLQKHILQNDLIKHNVPAIRRNTSLYLNCISRHLQTPAQL